MRTIISGSRGITDAKPVWSAVRYAKSKGLKITQVVVGDAVGVDATARQGAKSKGISWKPFDVPQWLWDVTKGAGHLRNKAMAQYADALIAVWDGESPGTRNMIKEAHKEGLVIFAFTYMQVDSGGAMMMRRLSDEGIDELCDQ